MRCARCLSAYAHVNPDSQSSFHKFLLADVLLRITARRFTTKAGVLLAKSCLRRRNTAFSQKRMQRERFRVRYVFPFRTTFLFYFGTDIWTDFRGGRIFNNDHCARSVDGCFHRRLNRARVTAVDFPPRTSWRTTTGIVGRVNGTNNESN